VACGKPLARSDNPCALQPGHKGHCRGTTRQDRREGKLPPREPVAVGVPYDAPDWEPCGSCELPEYAPVCPACKLHLASQERHCYAPVQG
jgi:hypothetical protein